LFFDGEFLIVSVDPFFGEFIQVFSPFVQFFVGIDGEDCKSFLLQKLIDDRGIFQGVYRFCAGVTAGVVNE